jgi:hypothetical protein
MQKIVTLQQWLRAKQQRRRFLKLKQGVIRLQAMVSLLNSIIMN